MEALRSDIVSFQQISAWPPPQSSKRGWIRKGFGDGLNASLFTLQSTNLQGIRTDRAAQRTEHVLTGFGRQAMLVELLVSARQRGTPSGCSPDALMLSEGPKGSYDTAGSAGVDGFTDP